MNKNAIVAILAIIGGLVVAGWVLRLTFHLLGPLMLVGAGVVVYLALNKNKGSGV
ncbi:MAG: hypothetical protein WC816_07195 [Sphingomonas sp.]|jgi:hypothetical protein